MSKRPPLKIGLIGGTGVEEALGLEIGRAVEVETPFGAPSAPITVGRWQGTEVAILARHGLGHPFNPSRVPYRANICALKQLGVTHVLATGATGSLQEEIKPRDLVLLDQVIDKTSRRATTFYDRAAVHVEMAEPFCPVTRRWLLEAASGLEGTRVHAQGTYLCMEGPSFSTRAESHMHRAWGADLVGMTLMPEARLAREAEMAYAMVALATDYDCWRAPEPAREGAAPEALIEQIIGHLKAATEASLELIRAALADTSRLEAEPSPAHDALRLAIWTGRPAIPEEEVERLAPLWGRYFDPA